MITEDELEEYRQQVEIERRQAAVDIAVLKEQVLHLNRSVDELNDAIKEMAGQVAAMSSTLAEAKGGWRTLVALGGAASVLTEAVHWILTHVRIGN